MSYYWPNDSSMLAPHNFSSLRVLPQAGMFAFDTRIQCSIWPRGRWSIKIVTDRSSAGPKTLPPSALLWSQSRNSSFPKNRTTGPRRKRSSQHHGSFHQINSQRNDGIPDAPSLIKAEPFANSRELHVHHRQLL